MQYRTLGANGPQVSAIGFGAMSIIGFFGPTDDKTTHACLSAARDGGITFIDTAELYGGGRSEELIGQFLKTSPHAFHIASKAGIRVKPQRRFDNSKRYLTEALEGSLRRLGVDHIDLYYIHRRDPDTAIEDMVETLQGFIQQGKIGGYGLSEVSPTTLRRAHAIHPCRAVQNEYSLWTRLPDLGLIRTCSELGVSFVPFSPLGRGMLTDAPAKRAAMVEPDLRISNPRFQEPNLSDNLAVISKFQNWARDNGMNTPTAALAWVLQRGDHVIPIPGTRTAAHLNQWIGASEVHLSDTQIQEIETLLPIGWAYGDRYSPAQNIGPETYS
ncbi:aldo/keto reductase [Amylibacter marinus]|uniref:Aldo/keto reductase n=1 Tax=Amylibacter marinus TaxID=1475483 RepID=A0ABQ5VTL8_9RHOB|nr:aldo/keto reductase [Amylibacter marinus]GLQ34504.1 aldo/keto reductase [Amylibacter marinus]